MNSQIKYYLTVTRLENIVGFNVKLGLIGPIGSSNDPSFRLSLNFINF